MSKLERSPMMCDVVSTYKARLTKLCECKLKNGRAWLPGSQHDIRGKKLLCCQKYEPKVIDKRSLQRVLFHAKDYRMCNHHNGRFRVSLPLYKAIILSSNNMHNPLNVSGMVNSCVPLLSGTQSTFDIERD